MSPHQFRFSLCITPLHAHWASRRCQATPRSVYRFQKARPPYTAQALAPNKTSQALRSESIPHVLPEMDTSRYGFQKAIGLRGCLWARHERATPAAGFRDGERGLRNRRARQTSRTYHEYRHQLHSAQIIFGMIRLLQVLFSPSRPMYSRYRIQTR